MGNGSVSGEGGPFVDLEILLSQAFSLHQDGRLVEAEALYGTILRQAPDTPLVELLLGILFEQKGDHYAALKLFDSVSVRDPNSDLLLLNRGNALAGTGRMQEALTCYDRGLSLYPSHADLRNSRGLLLVNLGHHEDALVDLNIALEIKPDFAEALFNKGSALFGLRRYGEAVIEYSRALTLRPDQPRWYSQRANALRLLGRLNEALTDADAALRLEPSQAEALNNRGNILHEMNLHEEAIRCYDQALAADPHFLDAMNNRGLARRDSMQFDAAMTDFDAVLAINPQNAQAQWSKGIVKMLIGELSDGLKLYEWRKKMPTPIEARCYDRPLWTGAQDISGRTLFLYIEQGLGDSIQFCRYALLARARGARVILSVQDSVVSLMRQGLPEIQILPRTEVPEHFDFHGPLMSMPLAFGTTLESIYAPIGYLRADSERVSRWSSRLGPKGFKIGVCWQAAAAIRGRSFPLEMLKSIGALPDVRLISLQKGDGAEQAESLPKGMKVERFGDELDSGPNGFLDTAAILQSLDLVITADTAVAHLAGALNRPTWVALKYVPDWRWFLYRNESPWYPSVRLFRQKAPGKWKDVFEKMEEQLVCAMYPAGH